MEDKVKVQKGIQEKVIDRKTGKPIPEPKKQLISDKKPLKKKQIILND